MPKTNGADASGAPFALPANLEALTLEELTALREQANAALDAILDGGRTRENLGPATEVANAIKAINERESALKTEAAEVDAEFETLMSEVRPAVEETTEEPALEGEIATTPAAPAAPAQPAAPQLVTASGRPTGGASTASRDLGGLSGAPRINPSLSGARRAAPVAEAPREQLAITASVNLPGRVQMGGQIDNLRTLGDMTEKMAQSMADQGGRFSPRRNGDPYGGVQVASVRNNFPDIFDDKTGVDQVAAYIDKINGNRNVGAFESMVAAGGWCAPVEPRYDFFNIAAEDGMIDLPTFGVTRGGLAFPVSPSLADTFSPALPWYTAFSNATVPWLWTNTDDILAVTGAPTKPCIRVPCSSISTVVLECYGICLTAGNLADNAWPESTRNFLKLLMAAHYHASNARYISTIQGFATAVAGCTVSGSGATAPILSTSELGAIDYRSKFGMADSDVIEWVYPTWARGLMRADMAKRTGVDFMNVTDEMIGQWFNTRGIRVQFVQDYQVRAAGQPGALTPITQYPGTVKGLMYAAGTVARGNGMSLDLGVVRDSTLNAKNDFTAAWMEECHLIAKFGHEVREYTINACPDGTTGAADLTSCCP